MREHSSGTVRENSPALYYPENPKDMLCFQTKMVDLEGCNKSPKDLEDFNYQNEVKRHRQDTESDITNISQHTNSISDEAHFWLNGYVNKQNCRIWSEANPQVYVETPLHPEKLTVWCALWAGGILLQKR
ncbi:hypothetical protein TNCV_1105031 [Trichonephila clavipes]|nr:hypothetical protein TNCV_1105031 [Trichonephila clavipes]